MSKQQVIEAIRQHNRSAKTEDLDTFDESSLSEYLQRLTHVLGHRGSSWVRNTTHKAVVARIAR